MMIVLPPIIHFIEKMAETIPGVIDTIVFIVTFAVAVYGAIKAFAEVPDTFKDLKDRIQGKPYRVNTTIMKVIIYPEQTQMIKLRTLRAHQKLPKLDLDVVPTHIPGPGGIERRIVTKDLFSAPGRIFVVPGPVQNKLEISFMDDEALASGKDHSILLSYIMAEKLEVLFDDPGVEAVEPVGSEHLVIEVYFPPEWKLKRDPAGLARLKVFPVNTKSKTRGEALCEPRVAVTCYDYNFGDGRGEIDWIRAKINKPQPGYNYFLDWAWEKKVKTP